MVAHLSQFVTEYEERLRRNQYVPTFSYGSRMPRDDVGPSRFFPDVPDSATWCCSPGPRLISASPLYGTPPFNTGHLWLEF